MAEQTSQKRQRPSARRIIRWTETTDQRLLLAIQYACAIDDVKIPWAKVVKAMGGGTTVSATIQHLTKLRKRLGDKGHDVPPPHRGGNNRVDPGNETASSEKEGDSYDSDGEEAFNVGENFGMARAKRAKCEAKYDHDDLSNNPGFDDNRFARRRNPEIGEGKEETLLELCQHSGFEPSLAGESNPPIYNKGQIGGFFDEAPKYRAFDAAPDAACTSRNVAGVYPCLELGRVPLVPETVAISTGRNEHLLTDHGLFPGDLNVDDLLEDPSFGNKAESQVMSTHASQELIARYATHCLTCTPKQHQHSQARGQSLTKQEITSSNAQWLAGAFPDELDEWNMGM